MTLLMAEKELYQACEVIFGPELDFSRDFLDYLQLSGVKCAYRKRALETHPDRFAAHDDIPEAHKNGALFHDVQRAYENLVQYLKARENGAALIAGPGLRGPVRRDYQAPTGFQQNNFSNARRRKGSTGNSFHSTRSSSTQSKADEPFGSGGFCPGNSGKKGDSSGSGSEFRPFWNIDELYRGPLPRRHLLLGHFLYYSGVASWRNIVQALIWQRSRRPRIGEISRRYGILGEEDISAILRSKQFSHSRRPFGEVALELGLLNDSQLKLLIQAQQRLQRKFGEYFLEQKILTPTQLQQLIIAYNRHNHSLLHKFTRG